ncbi:MAG: hypothetical protein ACK5V0_02240 [Alphaproteobacteria bacterium]
MLQTLGSLITLAAVGIAVYFGYQQNPALVSIAIGSACFTLGYVLIRLPQLLGLFQRDGIRSLLALVYVFVGYCVLSGVFYGLGWLFS